MEPRWSRGRWCVRRLFAIWLHGLGSTKVDVDLVGPGQGTVQSNAMNAIHTKMAVSAGEWREVTEGRVDEQVPRGRPRLSYGP